MRSLLVSLPPLVLSAGCLTIETRTPPPPFFVTSTLPPAPPSTPTPMATPEGRLPRPEGCTDKAVLMEDVTIPDGTILAAGESFLKTWRLKNLGTCPWDAGYSLVFLAGERMSAPDALPLAVTLPGETVDISVQLTAPLVKGMYIGVYSLRNPLGQAVPIGTSDTIWVKIVVGK